MPRASLDPTFDPAANTLRFTAGEDDDLVVVGNADRADRCEARIETARWGMRPLAWTFDQASTEPTFADNKLTLPGAEQSVRIYRDTPSSVEFELILHQRPALPRFQFGVEGYEDLRFLPQEALYAQEISDGVIRPEDTVDSIVVYHASRAGNQYRAGRWGHFKRAWALDADGKWEWGSTTFAGGTLTVEFDSLWMANAKLPITIGPNLGKDDVGASSWTTQSVNWWLIDNGVTAGADGTADSLHFAPNAAQKYKIAVYDGVSSANRITNSYEETSPSAGVFNTTDISAESLAIVNGTAYRTAWCGDDVGSFCGMMYDSGSSGDSRISSSVTYTGQMGDPGPGTSNGTAIPSIYLAFTAAGVGNPWYYYAQEGAAA